MTASTAPSSPDTDRLGPEPRRRLVPRLVLAPIRFYQRAVSPALPPRCRFYPSCSEYAVVAIERHGVVRGTGLFLVRLAKCAPWHPGGVDHVPPRRSRRPDLSDASVTPDPPASTGRPALVGAPAGES